MLDYLNHTDVKVLYGGIDAYAQPPPNGGGFALESAETAAIGGGFASTGVREELRATQQEINAAIALNLCDYKFFDTRTQSEFEATGSFHGAAREGHIPAAMWYPWKQVFAADGYNVKDKSTLRAELAAMGVTQDSTVVAYCTGGIRSGFMYMVLRWAGYESAQNYDGSWWEWAQDSGNPIETTRLDDDDDDSE